MAAVVVLCVNFGRMSPNPSVSSICAVLTQGMLMNQTLRDDICGVIDDSEFFSTSGKKEIDA